ncbi:MAG TPA: response regulator [Candidatus Acidoferrales bacterium]|nr:response regulator [Candidatus Acidoferrales bacterium]
MGVFRSSLARSIIGLSVVPLAVLLLFIAVVAWLQHQTETAVYWTQHSDDVLAIGRKLEVDLTNAGGIGRRYILIGTPSLYQQYFAAVASIPKDTQALIKAVSDNPAQRARAERVARDALAEVAAANAVMRSMHAGNHAAILAAEERAQFRHPQAAAGDEQLSRDLAALQEAEGRLHATRLAALARMWRSWEQVLIGCGLFVTALTILLAFTLGRRIINRLRSLVRQARAFAHRGAIAEPLAGDDEIATVSRALAEMAKHVRDRNALLARYHLLAEYASDAMIFQRRSDHRIIDANAAAVRMFGYSREQLQTMTDRELRVAGLEDAPYAQFPPDGDFDVTYEAEDRHRDGRTFPVEVSMQSATVDGEQIVLKVIRDLSERRAAERAIKDALDQAVEASRLKSEFVATMSHEIRTPMNGVIGATELLMDTPLDPHQREYAMTARESAHSLLGVINNILDFSKIEAGKLELDVIDFDVVAHVEGVGGMLSIQAHAKGISLMTYVDPAIPARVVGDPTHLRQVLVNLVGNAIKFTERGGVALMVERQSRTGDQIRLSFTVRDTGIGIDPAVLPRLFSAFTQADGSTTRKYGGTGLGLAITKRLVEMMGGEIAVESYAGAGSTFSFELDFRLVESDEQPSARESLRGRRALVVEDDDIARDILMRYMASWGLMVAAAANAEEALELLRKAVRRGEPFDLAILDLRLPDVSGLDLGRTVLADAELQPTKLVLVTAFDTFDIGKDAIASGFSAYLTKPIRQSYLYDAIVQSHFGGEPSQASEPAIVLHAPQIPTRAANILLVEDNEVNQRITLRQLEKLGYQAQIASNGSEAYELTGREHFDLVFMDCQMPVMDGFEATRAIRKREARTGTHLPIIAMTANALSSDRDACFAAGMDDYVSKPAATHDLRSALERWLRLRSGTPVIDMERLMLLFDGNRAEIAAFLADLVPSAERLCSRIRAESDDATLRNLAHELKGAAGNAGATELAATARELEDLLKNGRAGDRDAIDAALARIAEAQKRLAAAARMEMPT